MSCVVEVTAASSPESDRGTRLPRLKSRAQFLRVAKGRRAGAPGLVLQCRARTAASGEEGLVPRVGFTVTRKVGNAVVRNRVKRRLRAVADEILPAQARPGYDYVIIGRSEAEARDFRALCGDLQRALVKVHAPATSHGVDESKNRPRRGARRKMGTD